MALGVFVLSLAIIPFIPKTFVPSTDSTRALLQVELPPGARLDESLAAGREVRERLRKIPEVESIFTTIGAESGESMGGGLSFPEVRKLNLTLQFKKDRTRSTAQLEDVVRAQMHSMPGVRVSFAAAGPGDRLSLVLAGRDSEQLAVAARDLAAAIRTLPGLGTVSTSAALLRPELVIRPDPARAADLGVSTVDIADAARVAGGFTS